MLLPLPCASSLSLKVVRLPLSCSVPLTVSTTPLCPIRTLQVQGFLTHHRPRVKYTLTQRTKGLTLSSDVWGLDIYLLPVLLVYGITRVFYCYSSQVASCDLETEWKV